MSVAYVDSSAIVKLLRQESETGALRAFFGAASALSSSTLLRVEVICAARRLGRSAALAEAVMEGILLLPMNELVVKGAVHAFDPPRRALDALHLATAHLHRGSIGAFVTYDRDQAAAARKLGLEVVSPA